MRKDLVAAHGAHLVQNGFKTPEGLPLSKSELPSVPAVGDKLVYDDPIFPFPVEGTIETVLPGKGSILLVDDHEGTEIFVPEEFYQFLYPQAEAEEFGYRYRDDEPSELITEPVPSPTKDAWHEPGGERLQFEPTFRLRRP